MWGREGEEGKGEGERGEGRGEGGKGEGEEGGRRGRDSPLHAMQKMQRKATPSERGEGEHSPPAKGEKTATQKKEMGKAAPSKGGVKVASPVG